MFRQFGILVLAGFLHSAATAQDTLPSFTLVNKGNNRIVVSWNNPYGKTIHQLSIQRSLDSTKNFRSILTLPDPTVLQNGYVDTKAVTEHMFYRLYILLDSGKYVFSKSKRPAPDTGRLNDLSKNGRLVEPLATEPSIPGITPFPDETRPKLSEKKEPLRPENKPRELPERIIFVKKRDTLVAQIGERSLRRFRDSLALRTKDTVSFSTADTLVIKPFVPKEVYRPSRYVFTEKDGDIRIALPLAAEKKYTLKFFDEFNMPILEIKQIKDSQLTLDKANFMHAGWFTFELYEDGVLKEKHKLFIPKDF
ncbi:MAG: hypothetical protein ABI813_10970 [Bacteroidota bacterium]